MSQVTGREDDAVSEAAALARDIASDIGSILITHYPDRDTLDTFRPGETDLETVLAVGAEQVTRQLFECRSFLVVEGRNQAVGDRARRGAIFRARGSGGAIDAQYPKRLGPAEAFDAVDPAATVLRGVVSPMHPAPERRPIGPLDEYFHAPRGQFDGHSPMHLEDCFQVGLAWTERVERIAIRIVSNQDGTDLGGDVPRQCSSLADGVVLPTGDL